MLDFSVTKSWILNRTIFISYPKSGRTWMRYIFSLVNFDVEFSHAGYGTYEIEQIGTEFNGVKKSVIGRRNIFMYRNPLDTAVSMYFQIHRTDFSEHCSGYSQKYEKLEKLRRLPPDDINEFVLHPVWGCENVCKFNRAWYDFLQKKNNALIICYEEVRRNPSHSISKILDYLSVRDYDIDDLVNKSSFENMREVELRGENKKLRLNGLQGGDFESLKVRKGIVKGYMDYITTETIRLAGDIVKKYNFEI